MEGRDVWRRSFLRIVAMVLLVVIVTVLMVRWFLQRPVTRAAEWLRRLRQGNAEVGEGAKEFGYLVPLANEVTSLAENLTRARAAAEAEARLRDAAEACLDRGPPRRTCPRTPGQRKTFRCL